MVHPLQIAVFEIPVRHLCASKLKAAFQSQREVGSVKFSAWMFISYSADVSQPSIYKTQEWDLKYYFISPKVQRRAKGREREREDRMSEN